MKVSRRIALVTSAIAMLIVVTAAIVFTTKPKDAATNAPAQSTSQQGAAQVQNSNHISYKGVNGKTALQLLKEQASIETKDSSYGVYVDAINGVKSGTDGKYWTFYVNGAMATNGADAYQTQGGEVIEWKFQ